MAITSQIEIKEFTLFKHNRCCQIILDEVFYKDGVEAARNQYSTASFEPGMIEKVKDFIGLESSPEITALQEYWTPELIEEHNAEMQANEPG